MGYSIPKMKKVLARFKERQVSVCTVKTPREKDNQVDLLSRMVITQMKSLPQGVRAEIISILSTMKPCDVFSYESQPYWIDPIVKYLKTGELPLYLEQLDSP